MNSARRRSIILTLALIGLTLTSAGLPARAAGQRCKGVQADPAVDLQAVLDRSPEGSVICLAPGLYRPGAPLHPKQGQTLIGSTKVVISGARVVEGFGREGSDFVASAPLPEAASTYGECSRPGCSISQDVYVDGVPLVRALSRDQLGSGRFFQDFSQKRLYLRDDPAGHLVEQAFLPAVFEASGPAVTVSDLVVEKAATEAQRAAVTGGVGWRIEHLEVRYSHGVGITCADHCTARGNYVHHNGELGVGGSGGSDALYEANEIAFNSLAGYDTAWEAGGGKWTQLKNLVVRNNYVHDNRGPGLWTDINADQVTFADNYVSRNSHMGIFHEISYAATISGNTVVGNGFDPSLDRDGWGGAGIRVAASPGVRISENTVAGNRNGIVAVQQDRHDSPDDRGPHRIKGLEVRSNSITMNRGTTGFVQDIGDGGVFSAASRNVFATNRYHLDSLSSLRFAWNDRMYSAREWVNDGNDKDGTFDTAAPPDPAPPKLAVGPRAD